MILRRLLLISDRRAGYTLTELAIVLMIVAIILGGLWVSVEHVWDNYRAGRAAQQLGKSAQDIREFYLNSQVLPWAIGTDITQNLDTLGLFPGEMRRNPSAGAGASVLDNPFNSAITGGSFHVLSEACPGGTTATCFRVTMKGLSTGGCTRLLEAVPVNDSDLAIVKVGAQAMVQSTTAVTSPVTASVAASWCNAGANANEVDWDLKLHN